VTKNKAHVRGYMWIGRRIFPKMLLYALVFLSILIVELVIFALHYPVENYEFKVFFVLLLLITGSAMAVFSVEALLHQRRTKIRQHTATE
jgi:hypothetical protein